MGIHFYKNVLSEINLPLKELQMGIKTSRLFVNGKLSKKDMEYLKSRTRYDKTTIKKMHKGFKQDCPNGELTKIQFVEMYKKNFPAGNANEFCDHIFRIFDSDQNGNIDFKEFLLALNVTSAGSADSKLKWTFR